MITPVSNSTQRKQWSVAAYYALGPLPLTKVVGR
jgi:hypothetical protein